MLRRVVGPFKEFGLLAGTLYVIDRLLQRLSPKLGLYVYELMVQPISSKTLLPPNLTKNLSFAEIDRSHADISLMPAREDIKAQRFEQGARCLGVYRRDQLIGYVWLAFGRYEEDEVRCTYELVDAAHSVFDFDLYVLPKHRMGIAFVAIWHGANEYLRERGVRYTFSRLTRFNLASRRAHARLGGHCAGRVFFLKAWKLEAMLATVAPYVALTWSARVRLRLVPDVLATPSAPNSTAAEHRADSGLT